MIDADRLAKNPTMHSGARPPRVPRLRRAAARILVGRGFPRHSGKLRLPGLKSAVEVFRDRWGIPHIYAGNERDLKIALGFVHAQDRLWQMESFRRTATGTLSEVVGETSLLADRFYRLIGLPRLCDKAVQNLAPEEMASMEAYAAGVNAFLALRGKRLPLEFRSLRFTPEPWRPADSFAGLALNAWFLQSGYLKKILAVRRRQRLSRKQWDELFPSDPEVNLPEDDHFERFRKLRIGDFLPEAFGFSYPLIAGNAGSAAGGGSNNWAVSTGPGGKPMLANDPHLAVMVPQIWYVCHLHCPELHLAGVTIPGAPLLVLGRNQDVAWSFTNSMGDCLDLFLLEVDPARPTFYRIGGKTLPMSREEVSFRLPGGKTRRFTQHHTVHGPVLTAVEPGVEAVATLKWFGTLSDELLHVRTAHAFFRLNRARTVGDAFEATRDMGIINQNIIAVDASGRIGWTIFGDLPVRRGYSGYLPADGSAGMDWTGFRTDEEHPRRIDPAAGFLATANNRPDDAGYAQPITFDWSSPDRYRRIVELLEREERHSVESFQAIQMDCRSMQADDVLPRILAMVLDDVKAREAQNVLAEWDREMRADSPGAAIYEVFLWQFVQALLAETLQDDLKLYLTYIHYGPSVIDAVLASGDVSRWRADATLESVCREGLCGAVDWLTARLGANRRGWKWGRIHRYAFRHPGASGKTAEWLLSRGPYPAGGSCATVNVAGYTLPVRGFEVNVAPSMRFVIDMADEAKLHICWPLGQSGQPGHRHYDDAMDMWRAGEMAPLYLTRDAVEKAARRRLLLAP